jgi:hypothetical protein
MFKYSISTEPGDLSINHHQILAFFISKKCKRGWMLAWEAPKYILKNSWSRIHALAGLC